MDHDAWVREGRAGKAVRRARRAGIPAADGLDARGSVGAPQVRVARGEVAVEDRNETDAEGRVTGIRRGHRVGVLGRYYARGEITSRQHDAGQRFIDDWEMSAMTPRQVADLSGMRSGAGDPAVTMHKIASMRMDARRRFDAAVAVLGACYPLVADVLLSYGEPKAWAVRRGLAKDSGFAILVVALDALVEHYAIS